MSNPESYATPELLSIGKVEELTGTSQFGNPGDEYGGSRNYLSLDHEIESEQ